MTGAKASTPAPFTLPVPSRLAVVKPQADASSDSQPDSRSSLVILVGRHGERCSNDQKICRAILNDVGRNFSKRELNALVSAVGLHIPARIVGDSGGAPWSARRHQLAQLMHSDLGLLETLAYWCVDGWALALGTISDAELGVAACVAYPITDRTTDEIDAELFPIFQDEADEFLPQLQARLRNWLARPADGAAAAACMRTLYTVKGGARLVGAMHLGEMALWLKTGIETLLARGDAQAVDVEPLLGSAHTISATFEALRHARTLPGG